STSKCIYTLDSRDPRGVVGTWRCNSFVNSLHVFSNGTKVISADAGGNIITWDSRRGVRVDCYTLEDCIHISHIQASPPDAGRPDEEGQLLAANCFDNTLRVFHRKGTDTPPVVKAKAGACAGAGARSRARGGGQGGGGNAGV
ncbi:unnamed protein product, partial [Discosporangium mesarthrocarpum]